MDDTAARPRPPHADGEALVLSVDDNPMMADVIDMLVNMTPGLSHAGHLLGGEGVLEEIERRKIRMLVLDYEIPGTDTLHLLQRVRELYPDCPVLMLSAHGRPEIVQACRRAGAAGYALKDNDPTIIMQALQAIAAGDTCFMPLPMRDDG